MVIQPNKNELKESKAKHVCYFIEHKLHCIMLREDMEDFLLLNSNSKAQSDRKLVIAAVAVAVAAAAVEKVVDVKEEMVEDVEDEMVEDVEEEMVVASRKSVYRMLEAVLITAKETVKERRHLRYSKR
ncbi:unnamed protein product [Onchocerca ochengi]|uniref:Uncharacterized protein n=1 Tax=Onchocerca ochengi TaxID=42157 RepID=A0A182E195_ONCOC|nr:unnamed protein product [Onchocerca ochengi]VDK64807.1 unnamed protein product [Onchocerca ochengi]VDK66219.1 unnamed protein product [Onchocerca ochengi]